MMPMMFYMPMELRYGTMENVFRIQIRMEQAARYPVQLHPILQKGYPIDKAISEAKTYISGALSDGMNLGHGSGPMNHAFDIKSHFTESNF